MSDALTLAELTAMSGDSLAKTLFVVCSTGESLELVERHLAEHRQYLRSLEDQGVLFAAGPLGAPDADRFDGDGLLIFRADSLEEARSVAEADPLHRLGVRTFSIRPWVLNDGRITVSVRLSSPERDLP